MHEYDLLAAWFRVADWTAYDLSKSGQEGIVLRPLGQHSKAATFIVRLGSEASDYQHRKIMACLTGWVQQPPLDLLADLFNREVNRDRTLPKNDTRRLFTQSVVEDIVFSATRWVHDDHTRSSGMALLRNVVERTIGGEYWNTASYAITTLCRFEATGHRELLASFREYAMRANMNDPSGGHPTQESEFAQNLVAGNPITLNAIESLLTEKDKMATLDGLDQNSRTAVEELLEMAMRFDAG